jgi:hypothetical protein
LDMATLSIGADLWWRASGGEAGHEVASRLKKFYLRQYIMKLPQYYIYIRTGRKSSSVGEGGQRWHRG